MKKTLFAVLFMLAIVFTVSNASAVTINLFYGDSNYVGLINPDHPANEANEFTFIQYLITLPTNTIKSSGANTFSRIDSSIPNSSLPSLVDFATNFLAKDDVGNHVYTVAANFNPFYILAKYDGPNAGALVWKIDANANDVIILPSQWNPTDPFDTNPNKYGISHFSVWGTKSVPEASTMLLLGSGLVSIAAFRKRFMKK